MYRKLQKRLAKVVCMQANTLSSGISHRNAIRDRNLGPGDALFLHVLEDWTTHATYQTDRVFSENPRGKGGNYRDILRR